MVMKIQFKEKIPVANTSVGEEEAKAVYEVVKSGWISMGAQVRAFESNFAAKVEARHAVACNNGTTALHTILAALNIGPGDEVILPSLTFISTANVVLYQGATPVLAECDPKTFNTTADIVRKKITKKTKAIIPVDMMGMPVDYDGFAEFEKSGIPVIADSAESLGAVYKGRKIGSQCKAHIFSFFPNKNITTGEGGMIVTADRELAEVCAKIRNQGQERRYHHTYLGYNYRMTEMQAAIGNVQLTRFEKSLSEKTRLAKRYDQLLKSISSIETPFVPDYVTQHAWYMYTVFCRSQADRDRAVKELEERNIETRLSFPPIHAQPYYKERFGYREDSLPVTFDTWSRLINIPLWAGMGEERQDFIASSLREIFS